MHFNCINLQSGVPSKVRIKKSHRSKQKGLWKCREISLKYCFKRNFFEKPGILSKFICITFAQYCKRWGQVQCPLTQKKPTWKVNDSVHSIKDEAKYNVRSLRKSLAYDVRRIPKVISYNFLWIYIDLPISKSQKGLVEKLTHMSTNMR